MRITNVAEPMILRTCSSNAYLIRGDWNALEDVNTLIDVGNDPAIIQRIRILTTGVGKKAVDQVILTHAHSDHAGLLPLIREEFQPIVYACSPSVGADYVLNDGQKLRCGDRVLEVIYMSEHSDDSICLYCEEDGVLFAGDALLTLFSGRGSYKEQFVQVLERLANSHVNAIYPGHGIPILHGGRALLQASLGRIKGASNYVAG